MLNPANAASETSSALPMNLLHQVASDDQLWSQLESDPVATLAEHGVTVDMESMAGTMTLPSRESILQAFEASDDDDAEAAVRTLYFSGFFNCSSH